MTITNPNKSKWSQHIRSASYPPAQSNSKHVLKLMEQQIKDLQKLEASSTSPIQTLHIAFSGLASLYKLCTAHDAVLFQFQNQQPQPQTKPMLQVETICSSSRDLLLNFIQVLSNILVSTNPDVDADHLVSTYLSLRKQTARSAREISLSLRHLESSLVSSYSDSSNNNNNDETHMKRLLECVSIINMSVLDSLLHLLALPLSKLNKKRSCFSLISKFRMRKSIKPQVSRDEPEIIKMGNELYNVDVALHSVLSSETLTTNGFILVSQTLEVLQKGLQGIEDGLADILSHLSLLRSHLFT